MLQNAFYLFSFFVKETKQNKTKRLRKKESRLTRQDSNPRPSTRKGNLLSIAPRNLCNSLSKKSYHCLQWSFLHEHARPLNKQCAWRLTTESAFIKLARLKAIVRIIFLVGLDECARDLTKCVVCKNNVTWS